MAYRPGDMRRSFWIVLLFGLACVLAGVVFALAVPRFSRPKVPPHAPVPMTGAYRAPADDAVARLLARDAQRVGTVHVEGAQGVGGATPWRQG
jgi:hypothetical protein